MDGTFEEVLHELFTAQLQLLEDKKFPIALGGEHSLTAPLVSATAKKFKDLCVLHIGAHAEMRNEYQGNPGSHVCTMRRVTEICPAVQVGVRSLSEEEAKVLPKLKNEHIVICHVSRRTGIRRARHLLRKRLSEIEMKRIHFLMDFEDAREGGEVEDLERQLVFRAK